MLEKPEHGWTKIRIGDFTGKGSSITDIPSDALKSALHALQTAVPFSLTADEEDSKITISTALNKTYISRETDGDAELFTEDVSFAELITELCDDIEAGLDDWAAWRGSDDSKTVTGRKKWMTETAAEIRHMLKNGNVFLLSTGLQK